MANRQHFGENAAPTTSDLAFNFAKTDNLTQGEKLCFEPHGCGPWRQNLIFISFLLSSAAIAFG
jgi:hypothetical protein